MIAANEEEQTRLAQQAAAKPWLTYQEAAAYLGISVSTLYTLIGLGLVKRCKLIPGRRVVRFSRAQLDTYMQRRLGSGMRG